MVSRLIIRTGLFLAVMAALLFIPAGTADWPAAWVFLLGMAALLGKLWLVQVAHGPEWTARIRNSSEASTGAPM